MNTDKEFARTLADYLALHTDQSSGYLYHLIQSFLRGSPKLPRLDPQARTEIITRLSGEVAAHNNVPTFFEHYLLTHLRNQEWPPQVTFFASRYLRRSSERFIAWRRRQRLFAELDGEAISGTELGFSQTLYSQGVGTVFRWRGVPCFKTIHDLAIYAMLIDELRPGTIIELGSGTGGSALFFADLCTATGLTTRITSVDNKVGEVSDPRIDFVRSDCQDWLEATAGAKHRIQRPCLLVEDFHGDLGGFFAHIDTILEAGDYLFIEDSQNKQNRIAELIADRPYLIDSKYTDFFGINCTSAINSIFIKNAGTGAAQVHTRDRRLLRQQDRAWRQKGHRET
jgi:cephalosporin hydroxylase